MSASGRDTALKALVADVEAKDRHVDTGIVGTKWMFESLAQHGRADLALAMITNPTYPGYGYWVSQGATSLWERWEGQRYRPESSWNHVMFGSTSEFFFRHLAGIQQAPGTVGFRSIRFHPSILLTPHLLSVCANLSAVNASMRRPRGEIAASWACNPTHEGITYAISTPVGVPSTVHLPVASTQAPTVVRVVDGGSAVVVWDGSKYVPGVTGVRSAMIAEDRSSVTVSVGPGRYVFVT